MKIKMLIKEGSFEKGETYDVDEKTAISLLSVGKALKIKDKATNVKPKKTNV